MHVRIDPHSGEPVYRQLVEAVKYKVAAGELADGDQMPSIRALARRLRINPGTVVKAYEELQHAGLVVMRHGKGVFITAARDTAPASIRRETLRHMARRMLAEAARLGGSPDEVRAAVDDVAREMEAPK